MEIKVSVSFEVQARTFTRPPDPFGERSTPATIDLRTAECPYLPDPAQEDSHSKDQVLAVPQAIYVRTRPEDNEQSQGKRLEIDFLRECLQRIKEQQMLQALNGSPRSTGKVQGQMKTDPERMVEFTPAIRAGLGRRPQPRFVGASELAIIADRKPGSPCTACRCPRRSESDSTV